MSASPTRLKTALQTLGHTSALKDGTVRLADFELAFEEVPAIIQAFRRMVRGLEFDVSEMALTTYLSARAHHKPFTALPIFLVRAFHHGAILCNTARGIRGPKDLEGQRVGVSRGYTVTTGVWARSILQHEHDVDLSRITWVLSGDEHVQEFRAPANVVRLESGKTLQDSLVAGELAATIGVQVAHPDVAPLIPDAEEAGFAPWHATVTIPSIICWSSKTPCWNPIHASPSSFSKRLLPRSVLISSACAPPQGRRRSPSRPRPTVCIAVCGISRVATHCLMASSPIARWWPR